jgi:Ca2+-binding EF-hand superfamily protein
MIRWLYIRLLGLHPPHFRERFAGEMLWIFDQEGPGGAPRLIGDAAISLVRQWCLRSDLPETRRVGARWDGVPLFYTAPSDGPRRSALAQGALGALALMLGLFFLMSRGGGHPSLISIGSPGVPSIAGIGTHGWSMDATTQVFVKGPADEPKPDLLSDYFELLTILRALDTNHDLAISEEEMARAPEALRSLDRNHDGKLTAEHFGFGSPPQGATPDDLFNEFMAYDRNHDGLLEDSEVPERLRPMLDRAGRRADGKVPAEAIRKVAEAEGSPPRGIDADPEFVRRSRIWFMRVHPVLAALDLNHDSVIDAAEIAASTASLHTLDLNRDGRLTGEELLPDMVTNALGIYMIRWDLNGDGRISTMEAAAMPHETREVVESAHREPDGSVTESELEKQLRRRAYFDSDDGRAQLRLAAEAGHRAGEAK